MNLRAELLVAFGLLGVGLLSGTTVTFYDEALPTTMNPLFSRSMVDVRTHELVFDRLFYRSGITNELRSRLVEKYQTLEGGEQLKLFLKDGVKWHDDRRLVPADVCFTIDAILNESTPSTIGKPYREAIRSCEVDDKDNAVIVSFNKLYYNPRERLGFHVLPQHVLKDTRVDPTHEFSSVPIGSGPLSADKDHREIRYEVFENAHHSSRITSLAQTQGADPFVQVRTLLNAGVHGVISVAPRLRPEIAASDEVGLQSYDLRSWWFIAINPNREPLGDPRVRQALDRTIDREALRELTVGWDPEDPDPACTFVSGPFVNASPYYNRSVQVNPTSDLAEAQRLMNEAGASQFNGRWMYNGAPIRLTVGIHAPLEVEAEDLLSQVGNQLQLGGFDRQVFKVTNDDWTRKALAGQLSKFDILIGKWSFGLVEDVNALFQTRSGDQGAFNIFGYSNAEADALMTKYAGARTDTEAKDAYHDLHALLADDLPYLFLWRLNTKSAWRNEVRNNIIAPYYYFTEYDGWTFRG